MLKGNLVAYSGMTTKIRAMKNKLLSPEQYEEITHFTTVAELISFLQTTPAYGEVLASMDPALAHRGEVESRMTFSTYSDFSKIYHFAGNSQKKYLEYYFMKYEISILKACMRNIMDSRSNANPVLTDKHFKRHTKINIDKLVLSNTIEEFVDNLSGTLYEKPLREVLKLDNPVLFDFEMNLDLFFFHIFGIIRIILFQKENDRILRSLLDLTLICLICYGFIDAEIIMFYLMHRFIHF